MATPPGYAQCSYELRHNMMSRSAYITFGCDPTGTDPNALASQLRATFALPTGLLTTMDANVTLIGSRVSLGTDGGEDLIGIDTTNVVCTKAGAPMPPNVAALVHKRTARGGRRGRGRMYLPWAALSNATLENGVLSAADVTAITTGCSNWLTAMAASGPGPVVLLHRASLPGTENPTTPGPPNVVTSMYCDTTIATQRRRLGR
jgi:hypothetical protein